MPLIILRPLRFILQSLVVVLTLRLGTIALEPPFKAYGFTLRVHVSLKLYFFLSVIL